MKAPTACVATSPGPMGGNRVLFHIRDILGYLGMHVVPQQLGVGNAGSAFADDGRLSDERQRRMLEAALRSLAQTAVRLAPESR